MNDITLIQLVSAQATPNLLAAMALQPKKIIHCCTASMMKRSEHLSKAYKSTGVSSEIRVERLSAMPQVVELKSLIENLSKEEENLVLNFTGGTKLMSLGAFVGALQKKIPSIYVDTTDGVFVDGGSAPGFTHLFKDGNIALSQVKRQLMVHALAVANGCERVTNGEAWRQYKEIAEALLIDDKLEEKCHATADKILKKEPRNFEQAHSWWENQLAEPLYFSGSVLKLGAQSGLFEERNSKYFLHPSHVKNFLDLSSKPNPREYMNAYDDLRFPFTFFQGMWWEIAVMDYFDQKGIYRDLRWSVEVGSRDGSGTNMEEDILGGDDVNLLYVSCKRGGARSQLSRTIEDINSSAQRIGGSFSKKVFAVCLPLNGQLKSRVKNRCKDLGIHFLDRREVRGD